MDRKTELRRKTPIKNSRTRIRASSPTRASLSNEYRRAREDFLRDHPFCQSFIARHSLDELTVIQRWGKVEIVQMKDNVAGVIVPVTVPRATQIHHRNKKHGKRLVDRRWFLAVCSEQHEWIEANKSQARELGLLLPIQADPDGKWGAGNVGLETRLLMEAARSS